MIPPAESTGNEDKIIEELKTYLSERQWAPTKDEDGPIVYWKVNKDRFENLCKIVPAVLSMSASSGDIERMFSTATDILTSKRNGLKPAFFETLLFVKRNAHLVPLF